MNDPATTLDTIAKNVLSTCLTDFADDRSIINMLTEAAHKGYELGKKEVRR